MRLHIQPKLVNRVSFRARMPTLCRLSSESSPIRMQSGQLPVRSMALDTRAQTHLPVNVLYRKIRGGARIASRVLCHKPCCPPFRLLAIRASASSPARTPPVPNRRVDDRLLASEPLRSLTLTPLPPPHSRRLHPPRV